MAVEATDRHGARVNLELQAAAAPAADAIPPPPPLDTEAAAAAHNADGDARARERDDAKTLKLRLFQELRRSRQRDAWRMYWRALQQYVVAALSADELHCVVDTLLTPEAVELHNRFIVAILDQADSTSLGSESFVSKRPPSEGEKPADIETSSNNTAAKKTTEELSDNATKPADALPRGASPAARESAKKNGKRPLSIISSPEVSDENDIDTSVKKLLHFANSSRTSASREDTDEQSAELLIGLGHFSSK